MISHPALIPDVPDLLARAERAVAAQRAKYGTSLDDDIAATCARIICRTLAALLPVLRSLATAAPAALAESDAGRHLTITGDAA